MVSLITLAHRVSDIRASYAEIHDAVFSMSLARIKSQLTHLASPHCEHENTLIQLSAELSRMNAMILARDEIDLSATFDREFAVAMEEYIQALNSAIERLAGICQRICQDSKGIEPYDATRSRNDRVAYDESIQHYQRLGRRLGQMFEKL